MPHTTTILRSLCQKLVELYCPDANEPRSAGRAFVAHRFMLALSNYWHIGLDKLPGEETIYKAMHLKFCSDATKEKLAVFYYAFIDETVRQQMPAPYFNINSQRPGTTPYWNRYVEEYKKEHAHQPPKRAALRPLLRLLKTLPESDLKEAMKMIRERVRGK